jgi:hypothetical protein
MEKEVVIKIPRSTDRFPYIPHYRISEVLNDKLTSNEIYCKYIHEDELLPMIVQVEGQVSLQTLFGQLLMNLMVSEDGPKKWLEVGAWNGNGTTTCILEGLRLRKNKEDVRLLSYEGSPFFFKVATTNLERYADLNKNFQLVHGKIPSSLEFPSAESIQDKSDHYAQNYEEEKYIYESTPSVPLAFEPEIVILDGGEYSGINDWEGVPKTNLQHIFLDDIHIQKNMEVNRIVSEMKDWKCIHKGTDRNGWAYYRKESR